MATLSEALTIAFAHQQAGRLDVAEDIYRRIVDAEPAHAAATNNLGNVIREQGRLSQAVDYYRRALELRPDWAELQYNLGNTLKDLGQVEAACECFRLAAEMKHDLPEAFDDLLHVLQYREGVTRRDLAADHAEYERRFAAPLRATRKPHESTRDPNRPLRLGFVSADFARHPVGYLLIRTLENLDRVQCSVTCYSTRRTPDSMTARFQATADVWRPVADLSDDQLAEQIRADGIDILFDLGGHFAGNRLLTFARNPAPIQVTWAGYVGTTGLSAMDYLLADRWEVPPGAEADYCERVLRMPDGYVCFDPPTEAPPIGPLPALENGRVTFGSFNNPAKVTPAVIATWSAILRRLPGARLLLKYRGLDNAAVSGRLRAVFAEQGIEPQRVEFAGWSEHAELLAAYNRVDLALDTFPYSGGLTTCEALWMGVPVVTYPGETFAGRHSLSHLSNVGLTETIARDLEEYVGMAVSLAGDLPRLAALRAGLRQRVAASPLCDGSRFARNLLELLRGVWREWCGR
ncbi:MAG: tetratricopeptide repeat protein [Phycisphaerae bacterium]|nr:tetratricopeptide repeat protein [Phycisphaerae bacterium]